MSIQIKLKPIVGVDARPLAYGYTGNSRYLIEALKYLVRKNSHFEYRLYSNKPIHPVFQSFVDESGIVVAPIEQMPGILWLNFYLPKTLVDDKIDIFWGTLQLLPIFKLPFPTVVNYHDLNFVSAPKTMSLLNYLQHKILSSYTLENANRVFCLSENTKNDISAYKPSVAEKLTVIYPGANKSEASEENLGITNFLLTISTIEPRKNLKTLIDGYLEVVRHNSSFPYKLVIAGRLGWGESNLAQDLQNGTYADKGIVFLENPTESALSYLLHNCEFFLFPSKHEGFGLPIIEAMVEGRVCITSDIPVFREIVEPGIDLIADTLNPSSWAEKILEMSEKPQSSRRRTLKSTKWNWQTTGKLIETEITSVWNSYIKQKTMSHAF